MTARLAAFFARAVARLPFGVLYMLADVIYVLMYYVVRYRRKLVQQNLTLCLRGKTESELKAIRKAYYRNFADYVVETVKLLHISDNEALKRMEFRGLEHITSMLDNGQSCVAYFSHCFNWEWAPSITLHLQKELDAGDAFCQIYRPLRNQTFDRLMLDLRSRFGSVSIPKKTALRHFITMRRQGITSITGFMSDQKPSHGDQTHILTFLGRPTAVITGTEQLARRLGLGAVYWDIQKQRRGHYVITVKPMSTDVSREPEFAMTNLYFRLLEQTILHQPALWLWSHNRWKNSPKPEMQVSKE